MEKEIKALHAAALKVGTLMLADVPDSVLQDLQNAAEAGFSLCMELGPLPDVRRVNMVLVEPDGRRVTVASQSWQLANLH